MNGYHLGNWVLFIGEVALTEIQVWKDFLCCFRFSCLGYGARSVGGISPTLTSTQRTFSMCLFYCSLLKLFDIKILLKVSKFKGYFM